mmetsp:Transcript_24052/g.35282  ORF Transcript_24052/g.35282 Transcript_24052/m.35282 type:complete len:201 (-) Transcript_24052:211-813(-)|eukprot:CAMPEP_0179443518 /NCGR_PEP_ID=MMETSP0799-20121207/26954_1 /TAXON_ID=46947 /ORGANISM="Geminigera cryophila, Strain CCMP2564" /LENGTH=200 /DNA_ID=CAMNT_0021229621 /DNA_START=114 /DNA_END=716 /DNA_ORIENTATION=+
MGANASAQMAFDKAQGAVTAATGGITKCMSKDTGQVDESMGIPPVTFGLHSKGVEINDMRVSAEGVALACEAISQDKGYFECKIIKTGSWAVGVCRQESHAHDDLSQAGASWSLSSEKCECLQGDMLGIAYDQTSMPTTLKFYKNGELVDAEVTGIRGEVYPAVCVSGGSVIECEFDGDNGFAYPPPAGFSGIMGSRSLM